METREIIVICAWCKKHLSGIENSEDVIISHGICPKCAAKLTLGISNS